MIILKDYPRSILVIVAFFLMTVAAPSDADSGLPNPSFRPEAQLKTIDTYAEMVYWYTSEEVDWAFTLSQEQGSETSSFKTLTFNWAPGFRVGLGYNMAYDEWDTKVGYTWFRSKAKDRTQGSVTPAFFAARLSLLEPFAAGKADLNLHYNMFDWDLSRPFLISKSLFFRPSIGIKGGWITQIIHSYWTSSLFYIFPFSARENLKQTFLGVGPKGTLTAKWCFEDIKRHSFSLIGQLESGYLWGHWSIRDKFVDDLETVIYVNTKGRNYGAFMLHCFMGLGWDGNFNHDRNHCSIKLGYEAEDWFNQCQIFTDSSGSQNNDLILQGVNFSLNFDF